MEKSVAPVINHYWTREEFPHELVPASPARIAGLACEGYDCPGGSSLLDGMIAMELARVDSSIATFMGVHGGLAMGSIFLCGSEEQKQRWLPAMARMEKIGAFALTEPRRRLGRGRRATTTARRDGDVWVLNGQKKWIGNATFADYVIVWARDVDGGQVKGFVVHKGAGVRPGEDPGQDRAAGRAERADHAGQRAGAGGGPTPAGRVVPRHRQGAAAHPGRRGLDGDRLRPRCVRARARLRPRADQFGKPIASFQLVQDLLVKMLSNVTASACMCMRLSQLQQEGKAKDHHSAMAKAFCTVRMRRPSGTPANCSAATASCSSTRSAGSSPTPRRSTPTRAPGR